MNLERANWTLNKSRDWHVAWYHECLRIIDRFLCLEAPWNNNNVRRYQNRTNLCHYVRCTCLWGPLILLLHLFMLGLALLGTVILPIAALGIGGYVWLLAAIAFLVGIFWLFAITTDSWVDKYIGYPTLRTFRKVCEAIELRNQEGVSFWSLIGTYIVSLKQKVCPLIEIKENK